MRKNHVRHLMAAVFAVVSTSPFAFPAKSASLSGLSTQLASLRDSCAQQAQDAKSKFSSATFKHKLQLNNDRTQVEMDVRVYAVGHGRRETEQYLLDRTQQSLDASNARTKEISDQLASDSAAVAACLEKSEADGKLAYTSFKADPKNKKKYEAAGDLAASWLANLRSISTDQPQGNAESAQAWNSAKAKAELDSM